ncbi:MAG: hypothetical protein B7X08_00700 [Acidocella sp. 20-63-7]|nr:MAG: hypothetical protein B7X08_00700 [Acidocella sp. 20-63-7]HQT45648.1 sulfotransferase [Acidocella sp.]
MDQRPVFVFASHRSGSTLLGRILNCHPGLVVWGEHGGILNQLAALNVAASSFGSLRQPLAERGLERYVRERGQLVFDPWKSPVDAAGLRDFTRAWMVRSFSTALQPGQRWGFKEIRYGGETITRFLLDLFPKGRFLVLRRGLVELCVSNILAEWSISELSRMGTFETLAEAQAVVADGAYTLAAMDWRLEQTAQIAGWAARTIWKHPMGSAIPGMFEFLGLGHNSETQINVIRVISKAAGETDKNLRLGMLDRAFIEALAPACLQAAQEAIGRNGLDRERLLRQGGRGQYCFLAGDHELRTSRLSSMGWAL